MTLGIFAKTFVRSTFTECFDAVAAQGVRCVQFNFACAGVPTLPDELTAGFVDQIRREADARQIAIAAVSGTCNLIHPDRRQRTANLNRLSVAAWGGRRLGAQILTLCTGTRDPEDMWRRHPDNDSPAAWKDLLRALTGALIFAEQLDVTFGIEPEIGNVIDSPFKARRLLDELKSPRVKIIMDAANLFRPGDLPRQRDIMEQAFALLGSDIGLAHAKELGPDGLAGHLALGAGTLDWAHYLALLRQANFTGPLIMHGFAERDAAASTAFLRGLGCSTLVRAIEPE